MLVRINLITIFKPQTLQTQIGSAELLLPRQSIFYVDLDLIVVAAIQVQVTWAPNFDPLGGVTAARGHVWIQVVRVGSKGWRAGRGSRSGDIVCEIESSIRRR